ncbi:MAG: hypothetical protein QG656_864, partial [Candidatus Hydrogenedentes bacterium]|nr:hypothetical protein [Candidatus Hydrogenedentota bacterium]
MTETIRSLDRHNSPIRRRRRIGGGGGTGKYYVLLLAVVAAIWLLWITRDSYGMAELVPRDQAYRVFVRDVLDRRADIAASNVWSLFPADSALAEVPALLGTDLTVPEWILNNLLPSVCQLSGDDIDSFSDVLFVTRMSRIGCIVEKVYRMSSAISSEEAGGLHLRRLDDLGVYYAVRGRILAVSPSRNTLIKALTLRDEDALDEDSLSEAFREYGSETLRGVIRFPEQAAPLQDESAAMLARLGQAFASLSFAVQIDSLQGDVRCRGTLRPAWQERLGGLIGDAAPAPLTPPPDGLIMLSADFGKPVAEVWKGAARLFADPAPIESLWEGWASAATGEPSAGTIVAQFVTGLLGPAGPGIRFSWCGVDLNEMVPLPLLAGTFDADAETVKETFAALPQPPETAMPWDSFPRCDAAVMRAYLPLPGGPSLEPTAIFKDRTLLFSTSRTLADELA